MKIIDLDDDRNCYIGSDGEYERWNIDPDAIMEQPEIVQCKDCKHRIEHKYYGNLGESAYTCEGNMGGWILPDDFCSKAERRTDDE